MPTPGHARAAIDWFREPMASADLRRRSVRGVATGVLIRAASQFVRLGSLMLLARILAPADFGLVAMVMAVVGVLAVLQELGLSGATIRFASITHEQISRVFWINLAAGAGVALVVAAAAPVLGAFYADPRVAAPTMVLAASYVLGGAAAQHQALLRRAMRFTDMARIVLWTSAATATVSLLGAQLFQNYWALICGLLAGNAVTLALSWTYCDWRPGRPHRLHDTGGMVQFGGYMVLYGLSGYVAKNLHTLIIGRTWGAVDAGLYGRAVAARNLGSLSIMDPLGAVAPSAMAKLRAQPSAFGNFYYKVAALTVMAAMPIAYVCFALADEAIEILLGPQWQASAALLQLLAIGIVPQQLINTTNWVFLSVGESRRLMLWGLYGWTVVIIAVLLASLFGLKAIAAATALASWVLVVPALAYAFRGTPLRPAAALRSVMPAFLAGLFVGVLIESASIWVADWHALIRLIAASAGYGAAYVLVLSAVPSQRRLILEVIGELRARRLAVTTPSDARSP